MKYYAIIVAGGSGNRMQSAVPKQFLLLHDKPVLMHAIEAFYHSDLKPEIILVMSQRFIAQWQKLCAQHLFHIPVDVVPGGETRFHSVKNGLQHITADAVIAIHDAVRPLVCNQLITSAFRQAEQYGTAIPAVKSKDSIRLGTEKSSIALDREKIYLVQTPQVFKSDILEKAYRQNYRPEFTDDASVVEKSGEPVRMIEGDFANIKITYPQDMALAELYLSIAKTKRSE